MVERKSFENSEENTELRGKKAVKMSLEPRALISLMELEGAMGKRMRKDA